MNVNVDMNVNVNERLIKECERERGCYVLSLNEQVMNLNTMSIFNLIRPLLARLILISDKKALKRTLLLSLYFKVLCCARTKLVM